MRKQGDFPAHFFITGAANGIGRRLVDRLASQGERVHAADFDEQGLLRASVEGQWPASQVATLALDVRSSEQWKRALNESEARFGPVDSLMNVAGALRLGWISKMTADDIETVVDVNVKGVMHGTREAVTRMLPRGSGHVINFSSLAGLVPLAGMAVYSASKFAVRAFTLAIDQEVREKGVRLTAVCPDGVRTRMLEYEKDFDESALVFSGGRVLTVDDVVDVVLGHVLMDRPREAFIPPSRGWLARVGDLLPGVYARLEPGFRRKGLKKLEELRKG